MEKKLDQWNDIAELINKDKQKALDDFRRQRFEPGVGPAREPMPIFSKRSVWRPVFTAVAAAMLLVAGLIYFWIVNGSWSSVPSAPALEQLLADSLLYQRGGGSKTKAPEPRVMASFFPQLVAWGEAAGLNRAVAPVLKPVDPSLPAEYGDPMAVQRKMKKVIRENSIERMLSQFCQFGKEV